MPKPKKAYLGLGLHYPSATATTSPPNTTHNASPTHSSGHSSGYNTPPQSFAAPASPSSSSTSAAAIAEQRRRDSNATIESELDVGRYSPAPHDQEQEYDDEDYMSDCDAPIDLSLKTSKVPEVSKIPYYAHQQHHAFNQLSGPPRSGSGQDMVHSTSASPSSRHLATGKFLCLSLFLYGNLSRLSLHLYIITSSIQSDESFSSILDPPS